eukprot:1764398-Rhodomonas_salina.1
MPSHTQTARRRESRWQGKWVESECILTLAGLSVLALPHSDLGLDRACPVRLGAEAVGRDRLAVG